MLIRKTNVVDGLADINPDGLVIKMVRTLVRKVFTRRKIQGAVNEGESDCSVEKGREMENKRMKNSAKDTRDKNDWMTLSTCLCSAHARQKCKSNETTEKMTHDTKKNDLEKKRKK